MSKFQYRVTEVESERGWGQKYEHVYFKTRKAAEKYIKETNAQNNLPYVPDYYVYCKNDITIVEKESS